MTNSVSIEVIEELSAVKTHKGFTLIELMIVVAIVGILASIALPAYNDYTNRARVSEIILAASSLRNCVTEIVQSGDLIDNTTLGVCDSSLNPSQYVASAVVTLSAVDTVSITATGRNFSSTNQPQIALVGSIAADNIIEWACSGSATTQQNWLPASCK